MLHALRNATRSWFFRGFLIILASTFALFFGSGGSIFSGLANKPVATVGVVEISQQLFADEYVRRFNRLDGRLSPDQARQLGLPVETLMGLVGGALLDNAVKDLGIAVPNSVLAATIRSEVGNVSPSLYEDILRQQGFTVEIFENLVRRDLARNQLMAGVAPATTVPDILKNTIFDYRQERRIARVAILPLVEGSEIVPSLPALTDYHAANKAKYTAPEYRELVFLTLDPDDVISSIIVSNEEIVEEYEIQIGTFTTPDRRNLSQLFFENKDSADAALRRIQNGIPFHLAIPGTPALPTVEEVLELLEQMPDAVLQGPLAAAAAEARLKEAEKRVSEATLISESEKKLGWMLKKEVPEEVVDIVFSAAVGDITPPLQSPFGWHVYRIDDIELGGTRSLEEVREEIHLKLGREKALNVLYDLSITLEDKLAAGEALEEAGIQMGLTIGNITIDSFGNGLNGKEMASLPKFERFVEVAFATEESRESRLIDSSEGGYFILRVNRIIDPKERTYFEAASQVLEDWLLDERKKRTRGLADAFAELVSPNTFTEEAGKLGYTVTKTEAFTRSGQGIELPSSGQLVSLIFSNQLGAAVVAPAPDDGFYIGLATDIIDADSGKESDLVAEIDNRLSRAIAGDLLSQYDMSLEKLYGVKINNDAFDRALEIATQSLPLRTAP